MVYYRNFCKCHNVPQYNNNKNKLKKKKKNNLQKKKVYGFCFVKKLKISSVLGER
jgi:hypothetical protein